MSPTRRLTFTALSLVLFACAGGDADPGAPVDTGPPSDATSGDAPTVDTAIPDARDATSDGSDVAIDAGDTTPDATAETVTDTSDAGDTFAIDTADARETGALDTAVADTADAAMPDTSDAATPDTRDAATPDTSDAATPDTSDAAVPDTSDAAVPDTADASVADTRDAADAPAPYRHTITIDGTNDFTASEKLTTTSASFDAYVTWDASALYVGYDGPDIAATTASAGTKWLFAYLDTGTATGSATGPTYNTEAPSFPTGLRPGFYLRWKVDDSFSTLEKYAAGWSTVTTAGVTHARTGNFVEFRIPLAAVGSPAAVSLVTFMMNEVGGAEACFAGLYSGNFTDGYHATLNITKWLYADFATPLAPNDVLRARP
jgi:hypothetical protein